MLQVGGRAGRRDRQGRVIIQTSQSEDNPLLQMIRDFDYPGMAKVQLRERYTFRYPPYARLIIVVLRSRDETALDRIAARYSAELKAMLGKGVSNPVYPPVTRVQTLFVRKIMLKMELSVSISAIRSALTSLYAKMQQQALFRRIILHYDVDPH